MRPPVRPVALWLAWGAVLAAVTAAMIAVRGELDQAHVALVYLLVVLLGSASGGRALGIVLACTCFVLIDYYLQTPYDTLWVHKAPDWIVLVAFLVTAAVAAELLHRAHAGAEAARRRAAEVDRLAALGAETLHVGRADEALVAMSRVIRETIGASTCELWAWEDSRGRRAAISAEREGGAPDAGADETVAWAASTLGVAAVLADGSALRWPAGPGVPSPLAAALPAVRELVLPLAVHGRTVGVLRLVEPRAILLDPAQRRFLEAIAYYAALGIERLRLVAEAEHAEALREADRLKDALLASVSHDLRTPLTTIKALAAGIAAAGDERASIIEEQADRLNHLVADLLDISRLSAGGFPVRAEVNAAEDLVGAAIQQASGALEGREVRTHLDLDRPVPLGRFDFVHSVRVVVNLLENAVKYAPRESPIDVVVHSDGEVLRVSVEDRGPGIPAAERERIFQPFYRPNGVSAEAAGAGLGLAIARGLAEAQGGRLEYGDRPGGGSVFTLSLPAASL